MIRNKLGVYARLRGFEPTSIWSREVNPDGTGEHLHVIAHIPRKHLSDFEKTVLGWFPGVREADGGDHWSGPLSFAGVLGWAGWHRSLSP